MSIKNDPLKGVNYFVLGNLYEKMGRHTEATSYYQMALAAECDENTKSEILQKLDKLKNF
jgi:predicted negative regulator of RcsB-dependent stress response